MSYRLSEEAFERQREAKKVAKAQKFAATLDTLVKRCKVCLKPSSKGALMHFEGLPYCPGCLPISVAEALQIKEEAEQAVKNEQERLKAEALKPKPEGYGGWA